MRRIYESGGVVIRDFYWDEKGRKIDIADKLPTFDLGTKDVTYDVMGSVLRVGKKSINLTGEVERNFCALLFQQPAGQFIPWTEISDYSLGNQNNLRRLSTSELAAERRRYRDLVRRLNKKIAAHGGVAEYFTYKDSEFARK